MSYDHESFKADVKSKREECLLVSRPTCGSKAPPHEYLMPRFKIQTFSGDMRRRRRRRRAQTSSFTCSSSPLSLSLSLHHLINDIIALPVFSFMPFTRVTGCQLVRGRSLNFTSASALIFNPPLNIAFPLVPVEL